VSWPRILNGESLVTSALYRSPGLLRALSLVCRARDWHRRRQPSACAAERHRSAFYESVWRDAADHLGAEVKALDDDILEIRLGEACTRVQRNTTAIDDPVTLSVAVNKPLVYRLLAARGLCIPLHLAFTLREIDRAIAFMQAAGGEWVVKPACGSAGNGVTTGVSTPSDLAWAAAVAAAYGRNLLLEKQVPGDVYRLLYLDGRLLDAVVRKPPTVAGDGTSTIRDLVRLENQARSASGTERAQVLLSTDLDMRQTLAKQGLSFSSVPRRGAMVRVKTVINQNSGAENVPAFTRLCNSIVEDGAAAAMALGARLAGVDIITQDPALPLADSGGAILEVNTTPGYHYHYYQQGGGCPVARQLLSYLLSQPDNVAGGQQAGLSYPFRCGRKLDDDCSR
jgi:cyanophycin synthetase